jgi:hypothetical protein
MPVSHPEQLPDNGGGRWPHTGFRSVQWGDMEVGYTEAPAVDCSPVYAQLPGGVCQCPHYGYVIEGAVRCVYPGTDWPDEVAHTSELYFFPAGHTLVYDEPSKVIEINPAAALATLMDHVEDVIAGWSPEVLR